MLDQLSDDELIKYESFVENCLTARHQYEYSQKELAGKLKMSRNTYNAFETMRSVPLKVRLIARFLGIEFPKELAK